MAKVKVRFNRRGAIAQVIKEINEVTDSTALKNEVGLFAADRLRFQARIGKPLNNKGSFPSLQESTIETRKRLEKLNVTQKTYSAGRSNLTFSGQFLNSLGFKRIKDGIELLFKGSRKPYKTGGRSGSVKRPPTNEELDGFLRDLGFDVFTKSGIEGNRKFNRQITQIVRRFLRRQLRRS